MEFTTTAVGWQSRFRRSASNRIPQGISYSRPCSRFSPVPIRLDTENRVFATKTAPGPVLAHIVYKAVEELHKCNAIVKICVCDGCSSNKMALQILRVSDLKDGKNFFIHSAFTNKKIFCVIDVPHLFKCIRNNFMKYREAYVSKSFTIL